MNNRKIENYTREYIVVNEPGPIDMIATINNMIKDSWLPYGILFESENYGLIQVMIAPTLATRIATLQKFDMSNTTDRCM